MAYFSYEDLFLWNEVRSLLTPEEGLQRTTIAKALEEAPSKDPIAAFMNVR